NYRNKKNQDTILVFLSVIFGGDDRNRPGVLARLPSTSTIIDLLSYCRPREKNKTDECRI
ncbi:MAG: hypothetical protein Q8K26_01110, partial [Candidatus Gracilibacteria bacterium]|nr:hypothetical protein [Candidatus Gracilibacteria bacterium]